MKRRKRKPAVLWVVEMKFLLGDWMVLHQPFWRERKYAVSDKQQYERTNRKTKFRIAKYVRAEQ